MTINPDECECRARWDLTWPLPPLGRPGGAAAAPFVDTVEPYEATA